MSHWKLMQLAMYNYTEINVYQLGTREERAEGQKVSL